MRHYLSALLPLLYAAESPHFDDDTNGLELIPQHTIHPPFLENYWRIVRGGLANENVTTSTVSTSGGLGNWDFGASAVVRNERIALNGGWFRNINKLHSIFKDGWRVILRLEYRGTPEVPLIFTYSTMKGNYPFMWTELEMAKGARGAPTLTVKAGGLNVTQGVGSVQLAPLPKDQTDTVEVQFLYNRRLEKLIVNVGERGEECLRVQAELDDGYHFGLQSSPPTAPPLDDWKWYLQGFYFTSLPHFSFIESGEGKRLGVSSPISEHKSGKADAMHQFIQSREHRDKANYEHAESEDREQSSYAQRIAEAQRRRMEMEERWRKEQASRAKEDLYAADEDDDDDDDEEDNTSAEQVAAEKARRERMRKRMFDRDGDVMDSDYDNEYDVGGMVTSGSSARRRRRYQKHQVVNPNKAPTKPPVRRAMRPPQQQAESIPPARQTTAPVQQEAPPVTPPPVQQQQVPPPAQQVPPPVAQPVPPQHPPVQQQGGFQQPPPQFQGQYGQQQQFAPTGQFPYGGQFFAPGQQPQYGNPQQGGYAPSMPPQQQQQQFYQPPQQNPYNPAFQQQQFAY